MSKATEKEEEEDVANTKSGGKTSASGLELSQLFVPDVPDDVIFPEELNSYLRDRIQYLTHENSRLETNLSRKELQLQESLTQVEGLSKQVQSYETAAPQNTFSSVSNVASGKIVELSKKLREKSSELESLKTKCSKLERQLFFQQQNEPNESVPEKEVVPTNEPEEQIKQLQDKLNAANAKLFESKNANVRLKNELKLAHKFVRQEIGDTPQNISSTGSNWRGRAQVICDLQQKNNDLKEKLKAHQNGKPPEAATPHQTKSDRRLELLSRENSILKAELHEIKRRLEGARARGKLTESECSMLRAKVTALSEQQDNDRNLIATLSSQLSHHTKLTRQEHGKHSRDQTIVQLERDYKTLHLELIKERCRYENLQKETREKDLEIEELKNGVRPNSTGGAVDQRKLEAERIKLLELMEIANRRVEDERDAHVNVQLQLRAERQKTAKLEAKISRLQLEYLDKTSAYSLPPNSKGKGGNNNAAVEDRLVLAEETIKVLRNSLEMEQRERQMNFEEFAHILKNYRPILSGEDE